MKKVRTYLIAATLAGTVLTGTAGAAPFSITAYQGNIEPLQIMSGFQMSSCDFTLPDFLLGCPDASLPGFPGGDTVLPDQSPVLPDGENAPSDGENPLSNYESEVVRLVNEIRQENGLHPLTANTELSRVARIKSQDMADNGYFSHTSPTYGTPFEMLTSFGLSYRTAGENIAYGQRTPQEVVNGWMNSSGHRANILNASYTQIGVGFAANGNHWTQLFIG